MHGFSPRHKLIMGVLTGSSRGGLSQVRTLVGLSAAACGAGWRRIVGFELRGCGGLRGLWFDVDGAVGCDHLGDGILETFDAFAGDGGDLVEGEFAAPG